MKSSLSLLLAQAAMRGWFSDPAGFKDLGDKGIKQAAKEIEKLFELLNTESPKVFEGNDVY